MFWIQILFRNVLSDKSELLCETIWLLDWIPIHVKLSFPLKNINKNMLQKRLQLFVGVRKLKYNSFYFFAL
jgi:hypothetical protein